MNGPNSSFFLRHEFLIRRLHSLSGLIPVGAYMVVHLLVNSTLINGAGAFQTNVHKIHALGKFLLPVEWAFIFLPIIFHAVVGVWIIRSGQSNHSQYRFTANWRYTLQRWTGVIAIVFIFTHVFHLHGWFHAQWWLENVAQPLGMAQFRPYNAASTLAQGMQNYGWPPFYLVGILACVYHFANGLWTMGITWGLWVSPAGQRRATLACAVVGLLLFGVGLTALVATQVTDPEEARGVEDRMYESEDGDR
ncbi:MAG: succinate dehydrogenase [Pirellulaceae bacterium]|nr:MAG: succinate dehydrogenase [Pirellulaceae bacterium]